MSKRKEDISIRSSAGEYLSYVASTGNGDVNMDVLYFEESIWMTQKMMAIMYDVTVPTINEHIHHIYAENELIEESTIWNFRIVQEEGSRKVNREIVHYNLPMIIAVGFKVNSDRAVQFRKWINQIATTYTIKGWVMDEERVKEGNFLSDKYFDEQLE